VTRRRELSRFIKLPFRLYASAPNWVPPLIAERKRHLDRGKNPFFEHAEAEYFLAWRGDEPIGRISAHVDERLNGFQRNEWGLFGFFECEDDPEVAAALRHGRSMAGRTRRGTSGAPSCSRTGTSPITAGSSRRPASPRRWICSSGRSSPASTTGCCR
jgi:hypothetical protein